MESFSYHAITDLFKVNGITCHSWRSIFCKFNYCSGRKDKALASIRCILIKIFSSLFLPLPERGLPSLSRLKSDHLSPKLESNSVNHYAAFHCCFLKSFWNDISTFSWTFILFWNALDFENIRYYEKYSDAFSEHSMRFLSVTSVVISRFESHPPFTLRESC